MAGSLDGKVVLISGAARGQGRAHAVKLAREGAAISCFDLCGEIASIPYPLSTPADLEETVRQVEEAGGRILASQADVRDYEAVKDVVANCLAELGQVDAVVANAGISPMDPETMLWEVDRQRWDDLMEINVRGVWNTISAAVPAMIERGAGGSIVITSSTAGIRGMARLGDYSASKHAVAGLMKSFAVELAPHSIRVNTVHPTGVRTPMVTNPVMDDFLERSADMVANWQNLLPVEMIEPEDVSELVAFLLSDAARYVTGSMLPVDAGFLAH